ncbi:epoxide hydrolase, soluble (sEH) [Phlyctochytrium planicorne]|nr:epoxide hydrolase, soluble (sEH) [Phlyctochytrium planicorne]
MDVVNLTAWDLIATFEVLPNARESDHLCLSWCPSRFQPEMLVVGCGRENVAKVYKLEDDKQWKVVDVLSGHGDIVTDVSWAPNLGRSYQLIATSSRDKMVRIFKLVDDDAGNSGGNIGVGGMGGMVGNAKRKLKVQSVKTLEGHTEEVWKVDWNITGTVLSSSGDDGKVRLWNRKFTTGDAGLDEWGLQSVVTAESVEDSY